MKMFFDSSAVVVIKTAVFQLRERSACFFLCGWVTKWIAAAFGTNGDFTVAEKYKR